jgi:uncharacterized coiled-coil protein SlyX
VAHLFDNAPDEIEDLHQPAPGRRRWVPIAVAVGLALLGSASALLWNAWGSGFPELPSFTSSAVAPGAAPAEVADKTVGLRDFQAFQQQIAATLQSTGQLVAAQQAEIKRLSDQVATLAAKIDAQQRPPVSAQAAAPVPPPPPPPAAARKRPAAPKQPPPAISVGGAPLPPSGR